MSHLHQTVSLGHSYQGVALGHVGIIKRALVQVHPIDLHRDAVVLHSSRMTIGRDSSCDLVISDPSVSRQHAELRLTDQGALLLDLDSTNGVAVNGSRIEAQILTNGDHIQVGTFLFRYLATADDLEPLYWSTVYSMLTRDGLTRVFNRRYLMETIRREVVRCNRHSRPISVMVIDIDHFAAIKEQYGTTIGDQVLRQVALRLESILCEEVLMARTGGNAFTVVMVEATLEDAAGIAERCRISVGSEPIVTSVGPISLTISLGIATRPLGAAPSIKPNAPSQGGRFKLDPAPTSDQLLAQAAERLREAKRGGRNRIVF